MKIDSSGGENEKLFKKTPGGRGNGFDILEPKMIASALSDLSKEIISRQSLKIDALSGATATKVVFLKAIANAVSGEK